MNLKNITREISRTLKNPKLDDKLIYEILQQFFNIVKGNFLNDELGRFIIQNFGTFYTLHTKGRYNRNPNTKDLMFIQPKKVLKFKMSAHMAD